MNAIESSPAPSAAEVSAPTILEESESAVGRIRRELREFFHGTEMPYRLAMVRICLAFTLLFPTVYRWFYSREIFSTDGAGISLWSIYGCPCPWLEPTGPVVVAIHSVVILALITSCLGWCTRTSLVLSTIGYTYVNMLDILSSLNKSSAIASHVLFFLCFTQCGAVWSVDSWLTRRRLLRQGIVPEVLPGPRWPRRLIQILIATVYLSAGITKLQLRGYFTGEHLQTWMLSTIHTPNVLGSYLAFHPSLVIVCAYVTAMWELLFIFLVWKPGARRAVLGLGLLFHVMTCLTLGLFIFPMICLSTYAIFATDPEVESFRRAAANAGRWIVGRWGAIPRLVASAGNALPTVAPAWSRGTFAAALLTTGVGGVALEHKLDRYGLRRPEGPYQLQEVDAEEVSGLLAPPVRIAHEDKVLSFDIGSILLGGSLLDRRTTFHQGETLRVQCGLIPPHENMFIQCNLHDSQNRVVDTNGLFLSSDMLRAHFFYNLGDCVMPGEYSVVLKIAGEEIMRRKVTLLSRSTACAAN